MWRLWITRMWGSAVTQIWWGLLMYVYQPGISTAIHCTYSLLELLLFHSTTTNKSNRDGERVGDSRDFRKKSNKCLWLENTIESERDCIPIINVHKGQFIRKVLSDTDSVEIATVKLSKTFMDIFKQKTVQLCAVTAQPLLLILLFHLISTYLTFFSHFSIHSHSSHHLSPPTSHIFFLISALHLWPNILISSSCLTSFLLQFFFCLKGLSKHLSQPVMFIFTWSHL